MAPAAGRAHSRAILGDELFDKVQKSRVLVVGAGGIGCELIKNMVMSGFGGAADGVIEVLDLDTIDLSNLNRQFLFQKQHVKRPKAVVARETALKFNPHVNVKALHRNIKDAEFNVDYFESFDFVMNALDNLDARRHVNKMCLAANVPLIESGTSGYVGQVQPIKRDVTECFDCTGKPVPKTFAVCTIRSTPSTAHHCIAWAKSYLFPQLYGADDEAEGQELDDAEKNGENAEEIQELRKEAAAIKQLRGSLTEPGAAQRVFEKVYTQDINRLLEMEDMWKHRKAPHPHSWDALSSSAPTAESSTTPTTNGSSSNAGLIKDQRALSLSDSFQLFISSVDRLSKRIDLTTALSFDKDDDDTLDFVVASANLRASCFDIESQTRFQVKEYAGNIIPAIATTNAIIAGVLVLQALNVLRGDWKRAKMIWLTRQANKVFSVAELPPPNDQCPICRVVYLPVNCVKGATLGQFVDEVVGERLGWTGMISIAEGTRILYEREDFEDNDNRTLAELGVGEGQFLTVLEDEEEPQPWPVMFSIGSFLPDDSSVKFRLGASIPNPIPRKAPKPAAEEESEDENLVAAAATTTTTKGTKRTADDAELVDEDSPAKKASKVKTSEDEEGVIVIDDDDEDDKDGGKEGNEIDLT